MLQLSRNIGNRNISTPAMYAYYSSPAESHEFTLITSEPWMHYLQNNSIPAIVGSIVSWKFVPYGTYSVIVKGKVKLTNGVYWMHLVGCDLVYSKDVIIQDLINQLFQAFLSGSLTLDTVTSDSSFDITFTLIAA